AAPGDRGGAADPFRLLLVEKETTAELARQLLARYDRDGDGKLSHAEIGLERVAFDRLDANRDGRLDAAELARFGTIPADLELVVRLGRTAPGEVPVTVRGPAAAAQPVEAGGVRVRLGPAQIEVRPGQGPPGIFAEARD